jgi:hypothetical protein
MSPVQIGGYSNSVQLKNGNQKLCFTTGNIWEVNPAGTTIWSTYIGPGFSPQAHHYSSCYVLNTPIPQPTVITYGSLLTTTAVANGYQWYLNGSPIWGATGNFCLPTQSGIYMVRITDPNTCEYQYSNPFPYVYTPPQPVGLSDRSKELSLLQLYPNPSNGILNISVPGLDEYKVSIFSINGELVYTGMNETTLDLGHLSNGLYFCTVSTDNGNSITKKITINR